MEIRDLPKKLHKPKGFGFGLSVRCNKLSKLSNLRIPLTWKRRESRDAKLKNACTRTISGGKILLGVILSETLLIIPNKF